MKQLLTLHFKKQEADNYMEFNSTQCSETAKGRQVTPPGDWIIDLQVESRTGNTEAGSWCFNSGFYIVGVSVIRRPSVKIRFCFLQTRHEHTYTQTCPQIQGIHGHPLKPFSETKDKLVFKLEWTSESTKEGALKNRSPCPFPGLSI